MFRLLAGSPTPSLHWRLPGGRTKEVHIEHRSWKGCVKYYSVVPHCKVWCFTSDFFPRSQNWSFQWSPESLGEVTGFNNTMTQWQSLWSLCFLLMKILTHNLVTQVRGRQWVQCPPCDAISSSGCHVWVRTILIIVTCEWKLCENNFNYKFFWLWRYRNIIPKTDKKNLIIMTLLTSYQWPVTISFQILQQCQLLTVQILPRRWLSTARWSIKDFLVMMLTSKIIIIAGQVDAVPAADVSWWKGGERIESRDEFLLGDTIP